MEKIIEDYQVIEKMEQYGGSFVKSLAVCFMHADPINFTKLKTAFANYWEEYKKYVEDEYNMDDKLKEESLINEL